MQGRTVLNKQTIPPLRIDIKTTLREGIVCLLKIRVFNHAQPFDSFTIILTDKHHSEQATLRHIEILA